MEQRNAVTKKEYNKKHSEILSALGYKSTEWATWKAWKTMGRRTVYGQKPVTIEYSVKGKDWTVDLYNLDQTEALPIPKAVTEHKEQTQELENKLFAYINENQKLRAEIDKLRQLLEEDREVIESVTQSALDAREATSKMEDRAIEAEKQVRNLLDILGSYSDERQAA